MGICIQTGGLFRYWGIEKSCQMLRAAGFEHLNWDILPAWKAEEVAAGRAPWCILEESTEKIRDYFHEELTMMEKYGLFPIQAHAPFPPYLPGCPAFLEYAIEMYKKCILFCQEIGVKYLVIHGISLDLEDKGRTPEDIRQMNHHLYESLIPVLKETDVTVCLENLFTRKGKQIIEGTCSVPGEAVDYIDRFNELAGKECFGLCLDTGHLNLLGKNQAVYIRELGSRIKALHLHDNNGCDDEHRAPYTGTVPWKDVILALKEIGYKGEISFETFGQVAKNKGIDLEAVPVWLKTIYDFGVLFECWMTD